MISGVLNVYKEKGFTSHDVVAKLRGILKQKKIGHTGTLDPDAEGVLVVCLGSGTKLCDMLPDDRKTYQATLLLGVTTDTQDVSGTILDRTEVQISEDTVRNCISSFAGGYDQVPPMYSAKKVNGKKLYELARNGSEVERKPQFVKIDAIKIEKISLPEAVFTVDCSKGTYIRTLCHDIGAKLGCGGCMKDLLRTRSGIFTVDGSLTLKQIEQLRDEERLEEYIYPVDEMFPELPKRRIRAEDERYLKNGNPLKKQQLSEISTDLKWKDDTRIRVYDTEGVFCGIYAWHRERHYYKPEKMFLGAE